MGKMKRVLIITYYWPPSGGAGVQRWVKLSKYFSKQGIIPFVITVDPARASYALLDPTLNEDVDPQVKIVRTKTNEPYGIYKALTGKKEIPFGGFTNEEKQLKFSQKFTRFIRGNLFLPDARVGWNKFAFRAACQLIEKEKIDAIITTSPPHSTQLVGLKLKKKYNLPWLADLRDPWTGIYYYDKLYLTNFSKRRDAKMEKSVLENADGVVMVSDDIKKNLLSKSEKLKENKFHVIPNGFDAEDFDQVVAEPKEKEFVISYTGTLSNDYRIDAFLEAVKKLIAENNSIRLHITGSMPLGIKDKIEKSAQGKVRFKSHVNHHEAIAQMKAADLLLLVIPDAKGNKGILTGKLFEYLASLKPILCIGPVDGDAGKIINNCKAGETFDYDNENEIYFFLNKKISEWKTNGKVEGGDFEIVKKFSREEQAREVISVLEGIKN
jgi:glycosyltransferase involved in cell wall biosynthesis